MSGLNDMKNHAQLYSRMTFLLTRLSQKRTDDLNNLVNHIPNDFLIPLQDMIDDLSLPSSWNVINKVNERRNI